MELLKQGHLKDLLTERDRATRDKILNGKKDDTLPIPQRQDGIINVISGGSKVSGVSYAAAKRRSHRIIRKDVYKIRAYNPEALQTINFRSDGQTIEDQELGVHVHSFHIDWQNNFSDCGSWFATKAYQGNASSCDVFFFEPHFPVCILKKHICETPVVHENPLG